MKTFKVGDRVRIKCAKSYSGCNGKSATIVAYTCGHWRNGERGFGYDVEVDGIGRFGKYGGQLSYKAHELEPIVNPDEQAWTEFKRYLQPDPAVILAKEPA